jgi:hypothetical protein
MPYEFWEWEKEPEPLAFSARRGRPPLKRSGVGVLDPPSPPTKTPGPFAALPAAFFARLFAGIILAGLVLFILFLLFSV